MPGRIRVAIVAASDIVDTGLRGILARFPHLLVLDRGAERMAPDVTVYDSIRLLAGHADLPTLVQDGAPVVVISRDLRPDLAARALAHGAFRALSIEAPAGELVEAISRAAGVASGPALPQLYQRVGLTQREVDVLAGIAKGLSNDEICGQLMLSINSVKSYIRSAYRKIGVKSRAQAVGWCLQHGFEPGAPEQVLHSTVLD